MATYYAAQFGIVLSIIELDKVSSKGQNKLKNQAKSKTDRKQKAH